MDKLARQILENFNKLTNVVLNVGFGIVAPTKMLYLLCNVCFYFVMCCFNFGPVLRHLAQSFEEKNFFFGKTC